MMLWRRVSLVMSSAGLLALGCGGSSSSAPAAESANPTVTITADVEDEMPAAAPSATAPRTLPAVVGGAKTHPAPETKAATKPAADDVILPVGEIVTEGKGPALVAPQ